MSTASAGKAQTASVLTAPIAGRPFGLKVFGGVFGSSLGLPLLRFAVMTDAIFKGARKATGATDRACSRVAELGGRL